MFSRRPTYICQARNLDIQNKLTSRKSAESTSDVKEVTIRSTGVISDLLSISPIRSFTILETALGFP
jgi:hypothetical protein